MRYFSPAPGLPRFATALTVFSGAMLGIVLADDVVALYVFWEITSVTSFLLIGYEDEKQSARSAALQALLITGAGGLAMLAGLVMLSIEAETTSLTQILADPPIGGAVDAALVLVLIGAFTKSAQAPFHSWLPGAMAAPTPVSAYLHSATMVKAGVYLIARFAPPYAELVGFWRPLVMGVGIVTMLVGGVRALRQTDLKLLLAYGTVSQLGFLVALFGAGMSDVTVAATAVLLAHALFKAALFLVVGIIDHEAGTRDLHSLSGLYRVMPATFVIAAIATASMAGLPPLLGFVAKEAALEGLVRWSGIGADATVVLIVTGSVLTLAYGARFLWGAFATKPLEMEARRAEHVHAPSWGFLAPAAVLVVLTVVFGLALDATSEVVGTAAHALDSHIDHVHFALWHGVTTPLVLSAVTVVFGTLLFIYRAGVARALAAMPRLPSAAAEYDRTVRGLNHLATRTTAIVQNGSLPIYLGIILLTVLALPGTTLVLDTELPNDFTFTDSLLQLFVVVSVAASAIAAAVIGRRFAAVLLLGAVGYGVAVLFVIQGAPDLALTQLLIETLSLVIFVLVLRHLPDRFERAPWKLGQGLRLGIAVTVGAFVSAFLLIAAHQRDGPSVSQEYVDRALPEGGGKNIVNVILVDFRGIDTLGEITVLTTAALGVASLVLAGRHAKRAHAEENEREAQP